MDRKAQELQRSSAGVDFEGMFGEALHQALAPLEHAIQEERQARLMALQAEISLEHHEALVGETVDVMMDGVSDEHESLLVARLPTQVPDVDGQVYVTRSPAGIKAGDLVEPADVPSTRFNSKLSAHRVVDAAKFDFEDIRAIKSAVEGATVNDTVLAIVGGQVAIAKVEAGREQMKAARTATPGTP